MSVYFVYRSHYAGPSGKHLRKFDAESVLGWFQQVWERARQADDASEWVRSEIGADVYGFYSIFENARENELPVTTSDRQLKAHLEEHLYVEGEIKFKPHALQVLTDDDEIELAYYLFDDEYLSQHPGRADYLLHENWRLPTTCRDNPCRPAVAAKHVRPQGKGEGETYLTFLAFYDSGGLTDLDEFGGPCRIKGVRIPDLVEYLETTQPGESWPFELKLLRSQLTQDEPVEMRLEASLKRVARLPVLRISEADSTARLGLGTVEDARTGVEKVVKSLRGELDHDPSKSLVAISAHLAQLCLHVGDFFGSDVHHQWVIFDDLWAGAHTALAESVLRFAKRWDVLS
jgi:hypothetical protein